MIAGDYRSARHCHRHLFPIFFDFHRQGKWLTKLCRKKFFVDRSHINSQFITKRTESGVLRGQNARFWVMLNIVKRSNTESREGRVSGDKGTGRGWAGQGKFWSLVHSPHLSTTQKPELRSRVPCVNMCLVPIDNPRNTGEGHSNPRIVLRLT